MVIVRYGRSGQVPPARGHGDNIGHAGETTSPCWPGNALGSPREELEEVTGERLGFPAKVAAPATRPRIRCREWMDGWIFTSFLFAILLRFDSVIHTVETNAYCASCFSVHLYFYTVYTIFFSYQAFALC